MTENKNILFTSEEALASIIEASKMYRKKYNLLFLEAFDQTLKGCYNYTKGWYEERHPNKKYFYTWKQYTNIFYNMILGDISRLPESVIQELTNYYRDSDYDKNIDTMAFELLKDSIKILLESKQKEMKEIDKLERETAEIRRILKHQDYLNAYKHIMPFLKLEEAGKPRNKETRGKRMLLTEMFNYGFILGKRAERARKHKQTT